MATHSESEPRLSIKKRKKRAGMVPASDASEGSPALPPAEPTAVTSPEAITPAPRSKSTAEMTLPVPEFMGPPAPDEEPPATEPPLPAPTPPGSPLPEKAPLAAVLPSLEERVRRLEDAVAALLDQRAPEVHAVDPPTGASAPPITPPASLRRAQPWLGREIFVEGRAILRMYLDPRYRLTWQTRLWPPLLILGMVFSWWTLSALPLIGTLLDRTIDLVLAFVLYKVLSREATLYRQTSPDLPPALRL